MGKSVRPSPPVLRPCLPSVFARKHSEGQLPVPVVLPATGEGVQRIAYVVVGPLRPGVGVLAVGQADDEATRRTTEGHFGLAKMGPPVRLG